jgi:hypothetical protein
MKSTEIAEEIAKAPMSIEDKLSWHLALFNRSIPQSMIPVLKEAIEIVNAGGDMEQHVDLPEDVLYKDGTTASVGVLMENFKLHYYTFPKEVGGE